MLVALGQLAAPPPVPAEVVGVGDLVQAGADDGLGLVRFSDAHGLEAPVALADPGEAADEVDGVGPLHQQLGQDGVVATLAKKAGSDHKPRTADPSGLLWLTRKASASVGYRCRLGYVAWPSVSLSHQV